MKLETKLLSMIEDHHKTQTCNLIFHELWKEDYGFCVNDSWYAGRNLELDDAIERMRERWEIVKEAYKVRLRVKDLEDTGYDSHYAFESGFIPLFNLDFIV